MKLFAARLSLVFLGLFGLLWLGAGCANYQLGTGGTPSFHTVYVAPVANKTMLPQARELVTTRLREELARDGRVALANSPTEADATLTVTIVDFHRDVAAVREGDTGLARKFDLTVGVDCTLRERSGKVWFENRRINATREAFTDGGQLQSEYQTVPLLAGELAKKITHAALDVW
jgi:hypothetical protein